MKPFEVDQKSATRTALRGGVPGAHHPPGFEERCDMPEDDFSSFCIQCGHCVAICPTGAFRLNWLGPDQCPPIVKELELRREQAEQFLRRRRSIASSAAATPTAQRAPTTSA
jgi:ferredoxin